ncbi:MAG TPA: M28 family peptidase [Desulfuromonadales bacterium]|nr:M28 family peptidase [Desulfuromonadales bacterium]
MMKLPGHSYRGPLRAITDAELACSARMQKDVTYLADIIGERNTCHPAELTQAQEYISDRFSQLGYPPPLEKLYPDTGDFIAFCGNIASSPLLSQCIKHFRTTTQFPSEGLVAPEEFAAIGWSDHWAFWQAGYPAIMITDTAFLRNPHYHQSSDIPKTLDYYRMARVTEGFKRVVRVLTQ